jgi:hypothetical protein
LSNQQPLMRNLVGRETYPIPTLSKAIANTFLRKAMCNPKRYGIGSIMIIVSVMRLTTPMAK